MKHAGKLPSRGASSSLLLPPPAHTHRLSHAIAKEAPPPRKIRIIHVLEPEVIKTEPQLFRDLVQRLTGKKKPPPTTTTKGRGSASACASSSASTTAGGDALSLSPSSSPPPSVSSCDTAGEYEEGLLGGTGAAAAGIEMMKGKEEEEEEEEEGGFLRALELGGGYHDSGFYQGLEDFLLYSDIDMDRVVGGGDGGGGFHF